jgi:hypothetical protein
VDREGSRQVGEVDWGGNGKRVESTWAKIFGTHKDKQQACGKRDRGTDSGN